MVLKRGKGDFTRSGLKKVLFIRIRRVGKRVFSSNLIPNFSEKAYLSPEEGGRKGIHAFCFPFPAPLNSDAAAACYRIYSLFISDLRFFPRLGGKSGYVSPSRKRKNS